jgi:hypothetical protein
MYVVVDPQAVRPADAPPIARHANPRMYATLDADRFPFIAIASARWVSVRRKSSRPRD